MARESFNKNVKDDMLNIKGEKRCCKKAFLYGALLFAAKFEKDEIRFVCESGVQAEHIIELIKGTFGIDVSHFSQILPSGKHKLCINDAEVCEKILSGFEYHDMTQTLTVVSENIKCDACAGAFLRGAFLSCGIVVSPEKGYSLEFVSPYFNLSRELLYFMKKKGFEAKYTKRRSHYVIYFKESGMIFDALNFMRVHKAAFEYYDATIEKDIRNSYNRQTNCEIANLQKTIQSSARACTAIRGIISKMGEGYLDGALCETARLRIENPEASLEALAAMHSKKTSKSCVMHRLSKLMALYDELCERG